MNLSILDINDAYKKLNDYRRIQQRDYAFIKTPCGVMMLIFNCPGVKGCVDVDFKLIPGTIFPTAPDESWLLLDVLIKGKNTPVRLAFQ